MEEIRVIAYAPEGNAHKSVGRARRIKRGKICGGGLRATHTTQQVEGDFLGFVDLEFGRTNHQRIVGDISPIQP